MYIKLDQERKTRILSCIISAGIDYHLMCVYCYIAGCIEFQS